MRVLTLCLALALAMTAGQAAAQSRDVLAAQAGRWLIAPASGEPGCVVTLEMAHAIGGRAVKAAPECASRLPAIANAAAWSMADAVLLLDATRRTVARFTEDETAILEDRERGLLMVRPRAGVDRLPHASAIIGSWTLRRPGGLPICEAAFESAAAPGAEGARRLVLRTGCDQALARLRLASWRVEGQTLFLYGDDGSSLGFVLTPAGFAKRAEEGGRPLVMERR